jgi:hypothetical protein
VVVLRDDWEADAGAAMINQKAAWIQKMDISGVVCIGKRMRIRFLRSALIVKCEKDGLEDGCGQRNGTNPDAPTFLDILHSPDIRIPNGTFPKSAPTKRGNIDRRIE